MRAQVDAMTHKRSKWMTGHVQCLLRENAPVHRQEEVLHWICSPEGANSTCKGIKPGGAHFYPNTTSDHLQWAMTSYHERHRDEFHNSYRSCWFGGIAYLVPAPVNVLYIASSPWETDGAGLLALSGEYPINLQQVFRIPSGGSASFHFTGLDAKYDRKAETAFKAMARSSDPSTAVIEVEVSYDFDGDGVHDRTEKSYPMKVEQSSEFHAVVASFRTNQAAGSPFQDFEKGSVWLRILNTGAADLEVLEAGERTPSHVQIPYFPY